MAKRIQHAVDYVRLLMGTPREESARRYLQLVCDQVREQEAADRPWPEDEVTL